MDCVSGINPNDDDDDDDDDDRRGETRKRKLSVRRRVSLSARYGSCAFERRSWSRIESSTQETPWNHSRAPPPHRTRRLPKRGVRRLATISRPTTAMTLDWLAIVEAKLSSSENLRNSESARKNCAGADARWVSG